jgi:hypothetical protein
MVVAPKHPLLKSKKKVESKNETFTLLWTYNGD